MKDAKLRLRGSAALLLTGLLAVPTAGWAQQAAAPAETAPPASVPAEAAPPSAAPTDTAQLQQLQSTIDSLTAETGSLRQSLQAKEQEVAANAAKLADSGKEVAERDNKISALEADLATARSAASAADAKVKELEDKLAAAGSDAETTVTRVKSLEADLATARSAASASDAKAKELEDKLAAAGSDAEATAARVKSLEADIASGRADVAAKADELGALTTQAESVAASAAALQLQLQQANDALKQAQAQVDERDAQLKSQHAELLAATNDLSAAQAQLVVKAKENEALAAAGRELVSGGDAMANELVSLKQQVAGLQQDLAVTQAAALAGETRSHELESALGELTGPKAAFFTQLAQALPPDTGATIQDDRFIFPSDVVFKSASAKLTPKARAKVLEIGQALAAASEVLPGDSNWVIRIDGHTDRSSVGGQAFESNRDLAAARAVEVVRLLAKAGVPPERLVAASFGEFRPLDAADSAEAYQRNRRIELRLDED